MLLSQPTIHHPSLLNPMALSCLIFLEGDFGFRCLEYGAEYDSFTSRLARRRMMHQTATIAMIARRPHPPATPPAIGPARELLVIGVKAAGAEAVPVTKEVVDGMEDVDAEATDGIDGVVMDDGAAVEDAARSDSSVLSIVKLAVMPINSIQFPLMLPLFQ